VLGIRPEPTAHEGTVGESARIVTSAHSADRPVDGRVFRARVGVAGYRPGLVDATTAQLIAAYGGFVGGVGGLTGATFAGLAWWRGGRASPDLHLASDPLSWHRVKGPGDEPVHYGLLRNTVELVVTNVGNAPAHAVRIEVTGGGAYAGGRAFPDPIPMIGRGEPVRFEVVVDEPVERVHIAATWGQPPRTGKRRGPKTWPSRSLRPGRTRPQRPTGTPTHRSPAAVRVTGTGLPRTRPDRAAADIARS
jgi:hypothetical protein